MILQQNTLVVERGWQLCIHTSKESWSNGQDGGFVIVFSITFWWTRVRFHLFSFFFRFFKLLFNDQARKKIERPFWRFHLSRSGCCLMTRPVHEGEEGGGVNWARPQISMNAVLHCSDVELDVWRMWGIMVFSIYYNIGPYLMHSSEKVCSIFTQVKVLSMVLSMEYVVHLHHG